MSRYFIVIAIFLHSLTLSLTAEPFIDGYYLIDKGNTPFKKPTERFLSKTPYSTIDKELSQQSIHLKQKSFYFAVIEQEELGFMGYHAASHEFRVFQDIIKYTLEEVVGFEFKKNYHFLRIPLDHDLNEHKEAYSFLAKYSNTWSPVNDNLPDQRNQILSVNFTLFGNYDKKYECTPVFFERSLSFKPPSFKEKLTYFFQIMGMPQSSIDPLLKIGEKVKNSQAANLYQFFDSSHQIPYYQLPYEFIDKHCYASEKKGEPLVINKALSDLFLGVHKTHFLRQYRLVFNSQNVLNPYGSFVIKRYNLNNHTVEREYENSLREAIRKISRNETKVKQYREKLQKAWGIN